MVANPQRLGTGAKPTNRQDDIDKPDHCTLADDDARPDADAREIDPDILPAAISQSDDLAHPSSSTLGAVVSDLVIKWDGVYRNLAPALECTHRPMAQRLLADASGMLSTIQRVAGHPLVDEQLAFQLCLNWDRVEHHLDTALAIRHPLMTSRLLDDAAIVNDLVHEIVTASGRSEHSELEQVLRTQPTGVETHPASSQLSRPLSALSELEPWSDTEQDKSETQCPGTIEGRQAQPEPEDDAEPGEDGTDSDEDGINSEGTDSVKQREDSDDEQDEQEDCAEDEPPFEPRVTRRAAQQIQANQRPPKRPKRKAARKAAEALDHFADATERYREGAESYDEAVAQYEERVMKLPPSPAVKRGGQLKRLSPQLQTVNATQHTQTPAKARLHYCPVNGCRKVYKQAAGLQYHLTRSQNPGHAHVEQWPSKGRTKGVLS